MLSPSSDTRCTLLDTNIFSQVMQEAADLGPSLTPTKKPSSRTLDHHPSPSSFRCHPARNPFQYHGNETLTPRFLCQDEFLGLGSTFAETNSGADESIPFPEIKETTTEKSGKCKKKKRDALPRDCVTPIEASPRKRSSGKKDRHSKIYTAQGPRDRRMRLSLQIARKFFDLQDMLGFDKASKTIEWLFSKSRASIRELRESMAGAEQSSNCLNHKTPPWDSYSEETRTNNFEGQREGLKGEQCSKVGPMNYAKLYKSGANHQLARESRDKARARARERTMEKMKMRGIETSKLDLECEETSFNRQNRLRESSTFYENFHSCGQEGSSSIRLATGEITEEVDGQELSNVNSLEHQMDSVRIIEKFLGVTGSTRSSSIYDYSPNTVGLIMGTKSDEILSSLNGSLQMIRDDDGPHNHATAGTKDSRCDFQVQIYNDIPLTDSSASMTNPTVEKPSSMLPSMNPSNGYESNIWSGFYDELNFEFQ